MLIDIKQGKVLKAFEALGYTQLNNNAHIKMRNTEGKIVSIPNHRTLKGSVVYRIVREQGIDKKHFEKIIREGK